MAIAQAADGDPLPPTPFRFVRTLYDPLLPAPSAIGRNGDLERATPASGTTLSTGRINLFQWSGDNNAGGRSWAGTNLVGTAGSNHWIGLGTWSLSEGNDLYGGGNWIYYPKYQQDFQVRIGRVATPRASLPLTNGSYFQLGNTNLGDAIVVALVARNVQGGGPAWQFGDYRGNPVETGVFEVPAGMTLASAQSAGTYKLSELNILGESTPDRPIAFKLQLGAAGRWDLLIDFNADGKPDAVVSSEQPGNRRTNLTSIAAVDSGLLVSAAPAGGAPAGSVARTSVDLTYREDSAVDSTAYDRRPLDLTIPLTSRVSPLSLRGRRWSTDRTITVADAGGPRAVTMLGGLDFFFDLPLSPSAPAQVTATQSGTPATVVSGPVFWQPSDLYNSNASAITIRRNSELLWTYTGACGPGQAIGIDADGNGTIDWTGPSCDTFRFKYPTSGVFTARAYRNGVVMGSCQVTVTDIVFPERIACEVGFTRDVVVDVGDVAPSSVAFIANDPTKMTVSVAETGTRFARLRVKPLVRGNLAIFATSATNPSTLLGSRAVDTFAVDMGARFGHVVSATTGIGNTGFQMQPYLPNVTFSFSLFASKSSFRGGAKSFTITTGAAESSLGEPGFTTSTDPATGETVGSFRFDIDTSANETKACFGVSGSEAQTTTPGQWVSISSGGGVNGNVCHVKGFKTLIFTRADDPYEDEVKPDPEFIDTNGDGIPDAPNPDRFNPENWLSRQWSLKTLDYCVLNSTSTSCGVTYQFKVSGPPNNAGLVDNPLPALFAKVSNTSNQTQCLGYCRDIVPQMDTGTIPGHYTSFAEVVTGKQISSNAQVGEFWISKLDASGIDTGERDKFPDYVPAMRRRTGDAEDPIIQMNWGGDRSNADCSLYGYCCPVVLNQWNVTAIAKGAFGKNDRVTYRTRWCLSDGNFNKPSTRNLGVTSTPSCLTPPSIIASGVLPEEQETVTIVFPPGRHDLRLEVYERKTSKLVGWAEIHSLVVETRQSDNVPIRPQLDVPMRWKVGIPFHLTNHSDGLGVDARLQVLPGGISSDPVRPRCRVSPDGYPQNEYWVQSDDRADLAQVSHIPHGTASGDTQPDPVNSPDFVRTAPPQRFYLQGYLKKSNVKNDVRLHIDGQALIEACSDPCDSLLGSPVTVQWQDTDEEPFTIIEYRADFERATDDVTDFIPGFETEEQRPLVKITQPADGSYIPASSNSAGVSIFVSGTVMDIAAELAGVPPVVTVNGQSATVSGGGSTYSFSANVTVVDNYVGVVATNSLGVTGRRELLVGREFPNESRDVPSNPPESLSAPGTWSYLGYAFQISGTPKVGVLSLPITAVDIITKATVSGTLNFISQTIDSATDLPLLTYGGTLPGIGPISIAVIPVQEAQAGIIRVFSAKILFGTPNISENIVTFVESGPGTGIFKAQKFEILITSSQTLSANRIDTISVKLYRPFSPVVRQDLTETGLATNTFSTAGFSVRLFDLETYGTKLPVVLVTHNGLGLTAEPVLVFTNGLESANSLVATRFESSPLIYSIPSPPIAGPGVPPQSILGAVRYRATVLDYPDLLPVQAARRIILDTGKPNGDTEMTFVAAVDSSIKLKAFGQRLISEPFIFDPRRVAAKSSVANWPVILRGDTGGESPRYFENPPTNPTPPEVPDKDVYEIVLDGMDGDVPSGVQLTMFVRRDPAKAGFITLKQNTMLAGGKVRLRIANQEREGANALELGADINRFGVPIDLLQWNTLNAIAATYDGTKFSESIRVDSILTGEDLADWNTARAALNNRGIQIGDDFAIPIAWGDWGEATKGFVFGAVEEFVTSINPVEIIRGIIQLASIDWGQIDVQDALGQIFLGEFRLMIEAGKSGAAEISVEGFGAPVKKWFAWGYHGGHALMSYSQMLNGGALAAKALGKLTKVLKNRKLVKRPEKFKYERKGPRKPLKLKYGPLNEHGRPSFVEVELTPESIKAIGDPRLDPLESIRPPGFEGGKAGHARGHLIGDQLGGPHDDPFNFVTMYTKPNSGAMRVKEGELHAWIANNGKNVKYRVTPIHDPGVPIPKELLLTANIEGKAVPGFPVVIKNVP